MTLQADLPNPFFFASGEPVLTAADWRHRREELLASVVEIQYGGLPPPPATTTCEVLHDYERVRSDNARFASLRVTTGPEASYSFYMQVCVPAGDGPFPVVLTGDGCWPYASDEIREKVLAGGKILARFNRVEIAPDANHSDRTSGLYRVYPDGSYGALAAWAWGYHRCVDVLLDLDFVDPARIAVVGHSRGGKTALLAGATDERIAVTAANNSGCAGAGCYRRYGPDAEMLADCIKNFPYWYGPRLARYVGREEDLPFDQHMLLALIAPRALFCAEGLSDFWSNPTGAWQSLCAAREIYRFLGADEKIGSWYREGGHGHGAEDWAAFLDFMDWQLGGRNPAYRFNENPYPEQPRAFSWSVRDFETHGGHE
jgi:dienelactone hydrolase